MRRDHTHKIGATQDVDRHPTGQRPDDEIEQISAAESDERPSLVDPLSYAPLILVGVVLLVVPRRVTTVIGLPCLLAGVLLAAVDALSSVDSSRD